MAVRGTKFGAFLLIVVLAAASAALIGAVRAADAGAGSERHRDALGMAHQGRYGDALAQLEELMHRHPDEQAYLYDYLVVLGWAEQDDRVLELLPRLTLADLPPYVLDAIGKSARNRQRFSLAATAYQTALEKAPNRGQSLLGLALSLSENQQPQKARALLEEMIERGSDRTIASSVRPLEVLEALAYVLERQRDHFSALKVYNQILVIDPAHGEAHRGRIVTTWRLGAPHLAADMARRDPGVLRAGELAAILADATAITIRWGRLPEASPRERYQHTDRAIHRLDEQLVTLKRLGQAGSEPWRLASFDLMAALRDRQRMPEVIALYTDLVSAGVALPAYALTAAADAYLHEEQPETARELYLRVLAQEPEDFNARIGLFYAYVESEDHAQALALADKLAASEPEWLQRPGSRLHRENPKKLAADTMAALSRAFADYLAEAEQRLEAMVRAAPGNSDLRTELAHVYLWRGWPRRALVEFNWVLELEPGHVGAAVGRAKALQDIGDHRAAKAATDALVAAYPNDKRIVKLQRRREISNKRELYFSTSRESSSGVQQGSEGLTLDAYLYGQPINDSYRPFLHGYVGRADFPEGTVTFKRLGLGLEYGAGDIRLAGELGTGANGQTQASLALRGDWQRDDHWTFGLDLDSNSNDVPLRARGLDIDGWSMALRAGYRASEARNFAVALQRLDLSDGNLRGSALASATQRLVTGPVYKLNAVLEAYSSRNSRGDAPYFNPARDFAWNVTLNNEWLISRRYARAFRHRLGLTLGSYWQRDYGTGGTWAVRYEHEINASDRLGLRYGIARARRVYDGAPEYVTELDLTLRWRF